MELRPYFDRGPWKKLKSFGTQEGLTEIRLIKSSILPENLALKFPERMEKVRTTQMVSVFRID
jgi:hypothetical protein